jgi:hypothetical protein
MSAAGNYVTSSTRGDLQVPQYVGCRLGVPQLQKGLSAFLAACEGCGEVDSSRVTPARCNPAAASWFVLRSQGDGDDVCAKTGRRATQPLARVAAS